MLAEDIVNHLRSPDILAVQEIQDNDGATDNGTVDASLTYQNLIAAIVAQGGPTYHYREVAPENNADGGAPGGNIRVGYLFRPDRVTFVDRGAAGPTDATSVVAGQNGPELTLSPGRVDPDNIAWRADASLGYEGSRKPLAAEFVFNGRKAFVINNHLKSKSTDTSLFGSVQPPSQITLAQREAQAQVVNGFVQKILAVDPGASVVVLGDLNDFEFSTTLDLLQGSELVDLPATLPLSERYTYNFDGNGQVLDHVLVTAGLAMTAEVDVVHVNSEFPNAARSSDHDSVIALLKLSSPELLVAAGDATGDAAVLWARSEYVGNVTFQVALDSAFNQIVTTTTVSVTDSRVPAKVSITSLVPGTAYYYRAENAVGESAEGRFRTAAAGNTFAGLGFGVSGDWRGELAPYPAVSNVASQDLGFFVALGDTIYADYASPDVPLPQARTLDEYRHKNNEVYSTRYGANTLSDLRASTAVLAVIDDHEVTNDFAGGASIGSDPRFTGNPAGFINDSQLYENGLQAYQEFNPVRDERYGATGDSRTADEWKLYRYQRYGLDAAAFVLDTRSFRDPELPGVANPLDPTQVASFVINSFNPTRTMLGRQQLEDFQRDLLDAQQSGVTWKFVSCPSRSRTWEWSVVRTGLRGTRTSGRRSSSSSMTTTSAMWSSSRPTSTAR